jgi:trypsin
MRRVKDNTLIGVVSFGKGCALPKLYGVYAKISSVRKWIKTQSGV